MWSVILPSGVVLLVLATALMPYPWHASCEVRWQIPTSCEQFNSRLITQMKAWEGDSLCPTTSPTCPKLPCGQNCLYQVTEQEDLAITGTHQTPVARYIDDLKFALSDAGSGSGSLCSVQASSSARAWYAVLDFSTNYCNLRNLVDAAGISTLAGFTEETQDSVCTQYSSRDCARF
eukprot:GFUD01030601.1.p1 GENE.GFUD01030601.1~~GFUD01030601.1.p1  ORF type:complete len:176 (+),score=39.74 GFUD01030601.1:177-704(+)